MTKRGQTGKPKGKNARAVRVRNSKKLGDGPSQKKKHEKKRGPGREGNEENSKTRKEK